MDETKLLLKKTKTGKEFAETMLSYFRGQSYYKSSPSVKKNDNFGDFPIFDGLVPVTTQTLDDVSTLA